MFFDPPQVRLDRGPKGFKALLAFPLRFGMHLEQHSIRFDPPLLARNDLRRRLMLTPLQLLGDQLPYPRFVFGVHAASVVGNERPEFRLTCQDTTGQSSSTFTAPFVAAESIAAYLVSPVYSVRGRRPRLRHFSTALPLMPQTPPMAPYDPKIDRVRSSASLTSFIPNDNRTHSYPCQELTVRQLHLTMGPMVTNKETKLAEFAARLNDALDGIGFPPKGNGRQVKLAKLLGVSQKGARKWLEGEAFPTTDKLTDLSALTKRSFEWLVTGRQDRAALSPLTGYAEGSTSKPIPICEPEPHQQQPQPPLAPDEQALLDAYRLLEPVDREDLVAQLLDRAERIRRYMEKMKSPQPSPPRPATEVPSLQLLIETENDQSRT